MTTLPSPPTKPKNRAPYGAEIAQVLDKRSDCATVAAAAVGSEVVETWVKAIRHVRVRTVTETTVRFALEPVHEPNTDHERRFVALMLMVAGELSNKGRAISSKLFRGVNYREVITGDGEVKRQYVRAQSAGGLAARLRVRDPSSSTKAGRKGRSVGPREVDRYLRIARAAQIVDVWQWNPKKKEGGDVDTECRGRKYGYAVFQWCAPLPKLIHERLVEWGRIKVQRGRLGPTTGAAPLGELLAAPAAELTDARPSAAIVADGRAAVLERTTGAARGFLELVPPDLRQRPS